MKKTLVLAIVASVMWISSAEVYAVNYYVDATGVNGGVKVRRVADQNRGTQALFTPLTAGCQTFFIS